MILKKIHPERAIRSAARQSRWRAMQAAARMSCRRGILGFLFLVALIAATVWIVCYRGTATLRTAQGPIFGTYYTVKYESAQPLDSAILSELRQVDASLSVFNQLSTLSKINTGASTRTDAMLYEVVDKAQAISRVTNGAFDITVMPLVNAWGFGFKKGNFPTEAQIDSIRQLIGYERIRLTADSLLLKNDPRVMVDCGAIAKGYGVDRVARVLREHGVRNFMVEIGGEVITKGRNPNGNPWQIAVSRPTANADSTAQNQFQTVLSLENAALATSGNYRNFYVHEGRKYAHTIDPRTGRPVQHSLLSATVIAPDCATADAYATAFMVMGLDEACKVLDAQKQLKAYLIYTDEQGNLLTKEVRMPKAGK